MNKSQFARFLILFIIFTIKLQIIICISMHMHIYIYIYDIVRDPLLVENLIYAIVRRSDYGIRIDVPFPDIQHYRLRIPA